MTDPEQADTETAPAPQAASPTPEPAPQADPAKRELQDELDSIRATGEDLRG